MTARPISRRSNIRVPDARENESQESALTIEARGFGQRSAARDKAYAAMGMRRQGDLRFLSVPNLPGPPQYNSRASSMTDIKGLQENMRQQMATLTDEHDRHNTVQVQQQAPLAAQVVAGPAGPAGPKGDRGDGGGAEPKGDRGDDGDQGLPGRDGALPPQNFATPKKHVSRRV